MTDRRARIYWAAEDEVWFLFVARWAVYPLHTLYFLDGVPPGCVVERVFHFPERKAFGFYLAHPSFDVVPVGQVPPSFGEVRYETVQLRPAQSDESPYPAYDALREENDRLRAVFADLLEDSAQLKRAYEQGKAEGLAEGEKRLREHAEQPGDGMTDLDHHPERRALLEGILDYPDDKLRRLVFADWLEENGLDGERCELMRGTRLALDAAELGLAFPKECRVSSQVRAETIWAVDYEEADTHRQLAPGKGIDPKLVFVDGFLYLAVMRLDHWEKCGPYLVRHHPLGWVQATDRWPHQEAYASLSWEKLRQGDNNPCWGLPPRFFDRLSPKPSRTGYSYAEEALSALANAMMGWAWEEGEEA